MMHQVLVIGHADADGHLIAEQVRRNLASIESFEVKVVVDPRRTQGHRSWLKLDAFPEISPADYVFFVDLMFAPDTYIEEAAALTRFVSARHDKRFFLIDHHPLPLRLLQAASNLRMAYRPDVCECAIGPRSGMMVVASLCEHQPEEVADIKSPVHGALCVGMRRAAAAGGPLAGDKLLALLGADRWDLILRLSEEDPKRHKLHRGFRSRDAPLSEALEDSDKAATELMNRRGNLARAIRMSYDAEIENEELTYEDGVRVLRKNAKDEAATDLGVIVTLLEVAALSLTPKPGATFSFEQLVGEARELGGEHFDLNEKDVKNVLKKARFVKKTDKGQYLLK
jgi:hypothetical protein